MSDLSSIRLFGLPLISAPAEQAVSAALNAPRARVAFVNAHCINVKARDAAYANALQSADLLLPDGIGIELAAKLRGKPFAANLNGTDLGPILALEAARRGLSLYLCGAAPGVAERAAQVLKARIPDLRIAGTRDGFAGMADPKNAIAAINESGAEILWVAMGVPKQDIWLAEHADALHPRVVLGVGALFDFLAGRVPRAPIWLRRARLEWLWRLMIEPRRMFGRYVIGNVVFIMRTVADYLRYRRASRE